MPASHRSLLLLAAAAGLPAAVSAQVPCYETNRGTHLPLTYAQVQTNQSLGFTFPTPTGGVSSISISSQGFVWLGTNSNPGVIVSPGSFAGSSRIAALWTAALDPSYGPGVFFNSIPASGGNPARAVITWEASDGIGGPTNLAQLQMVDDGRIVIYHAAGNDLGGGWPVLVGVSDFGTATSYDLTSASYTTLDSGTDPALFEFLPFIVSVAHTYDLAGTTLEFIPNGQGGYLCTERTSCRSGSFEKIGVGCPKPATFYEFFPANTGADYANSSLLFTPNGLGGWIGTSTATAIQPFANNLGIAAFDTAYARPLPFAWPHPAGVATTIDICADGFVWLNTDPNHYSPCCDGDIPQFLTFGEPCLAPLWLGLDPTAPGAGCYLDTAPGGAALITWSNCALVNGNGTATFQLALFPNGAFEIRYGSVSPGGEAALIGYASGAVDDPGHRDLTVTPWDSGVASAPMLSLQATAGTRPAIGTTFGLDVDGFVTPAIGVLAFGNRSNFDLAPIATGCRGYVDFATGGTFVYVGLTAPYTFSFALPNVQAFVGFDLFLQAVELRSGINALGLAFSNGGLMRVGS